MYFSATAIAEADHVLPGPFGARIGAQIVELHAEPGKAISKVVAKAHVVDYEPYLPKIDTSSKPTHLTFEFPPEARDLIELLQFIESVGSFWFGIKRVKWNEAEYRWEPESPAEQAKLTIFSFSTRREYPRPLEMAMPQALAEILEDRARLNPLVLPLAFYREGANDFAAHRYISAFFNYYFFIEDLFGEGNTKNVKVLQSFRRSAELRWAVDKASNDILAENMPEHVGSLNDFLKSEGLTWNTDDLLILLVNSRGKLHHFSQKSTKLTGHPLNQETFRSLAFFSFAIILNVFTKRIPRPSVAPSSTP